MHFFILLLTVLAVKATVEINDFQQFKEVFNKKYLNPKEEQYRETIFKKNLEYIENHNNNYDEIELDINEFSDLSSNEFKSMYLNDKARDGYLKFADNDNVHDGSAVDDSKLPETVDWRPMGNRVRQQGSCGSCWAYGTTAAIEYAFKIKKNIETGWLSVQELIDCGSNKKYSNNGCEYGVADQAYDYIVDNGINKDLYYSYHARKQECKNETAFILRHEKFNITGYNIIPYGSNDSVIMDVIAHVGPVTTAVATDENIFRHYKTGIIKNLNNNAWLPNHILAIVGYTTVNQTDVWIVRNSWGERWGHKGYGYLERGYNIMGINNYNIYPIL